MCYLFRSEIVWNHQQFRKKARHSSSCQMHSWDLSTHLSCGLIRKLWRTTKVSVGKFPRTSAFNINQHWHLIIHLSSQSFKLCSFEAISDQGPKRYEVLGKLTWWKFMLEYVKATRKKNGYFTVRLTVNVDPPSLTVSFLWFLFLVYFWTNELIL